MPIGNGTVRYTYKFVKRVDLRLNVLITYTKKQRDAGNLKVMDISVTLNVGMYPRCMHMSKFIKLDIYVPFFVNQLYLNKAVRQNPKNRMSAFLN